MYHFLSENTHVTEICKESYRGYVIFNSETFSSFQMLWVLVCYQKDEKVANAEEDLGGGGVDEVLLHLVAGIAATLF